LVRAQVVGVDRAVLQVAGAGLRHVAGVEVEDLPAQPLPAGPVDVRDDRRDVPVRGEALDRLRLRGRQEEPADAIELEVLDDPEPRDDRALVPRGARRGRGAGTASRRRRRDSAEGEHDRSAEPGHGQTFADLYPTRWKTRAS